MNNNQATNGFKTFLITLVISLVVFGAAYYLITENSPGTSTENIEASAPDARVTNAQIDRSEQRAATFNDLAYANKSEGVVLAGTDESTQTSSPVPATGSNTTYMLLLSTILLAGSIYFFLLNPRKLALSHFEKNATR